MAESFLSRWLWGISTRSKITRPTVGIRFISYFRRRKAVATGSSALPRGLQQGRDWLK
jgi:hypothetical protein